MAYSLLKPDILSFGLNAFFLSTEWGLHQVISQNLSSSGSSRVYNYCCDF